MTGTKWLLPLSALAFVIIAGCIGGTSGAFYDAEDTVDNSFQAWVSPVWVQTTQADFESGILTQVDTTTVPGDVLIENVLLTYLSPGTIDSQVLDTTQAGTNWNILAWDASLETGTYITLWVRASDDPFQSDDALPVWEYAGDTSPVVSGLPSGRYMQWRAYLTTLDAFVTPSLHEVRVYYE
jgi:hypothetical protein